MKTIKGMYQDTRDVDIPPGFAKFLKNVLLTNTRGAAENEPGFTVHVSENLDYPVIGVHVIQENKIFFVTDNQTCDDAGYSGIYRVDENGVSYKILDSNDVAGLNFCLQHPIQAEHYINFKGDRVIAFIDDLNIPRIINIDAADEIDDINDLRLFPLSELADVETAVSDTGGALVTGTYFVFYRYRNTDGTYTNWFFGSGPHYINNERAGEGFAEMDGAEPATASSKSLRISFANTDSSFQQLDIGILEVVAGAVTGKFVKTVTNSNSFETTYTGLENVTELTVNELVVQSPSYTNARAITQLNNRLYLGNVKTADLIDYQPYANNIKINYTKQKIYPTRLIQPNHKQNFDKSFKPGEVYAFYISLKFNDGSSSRAFHIPGRPPAVISFGNESTATYTILEYAAPSDKDYIQECVEGGGLQDCFPDEQYTVIVVQGDVTSQFPAGSQINIEGDINCYYYGQHIVYYSDFVLGNTEIIIQKAYQPGFDTSCVTNSIVAKDIYTAGVFETDGSQLAIDRGLYAGAATDPDCPKIFQVENTADNPYAATNMGYWENSTEEYPLNFPGYGSSSTKVRHHKFPTLRHLYEQDSANPFVGTREHWILGIDVTNVEIPASIAGLVQGFEIYYAEKTLSNSTVITFDQLHYIGEFTLGLDPEPNESDQNIGKFAPTGGPWELSGFGDSFGGDPGGLAYREFGDKLVIDYTKGVGHALDLLYGTPGISPDYIELAYKAQAASLNNRWIAYNNGTAIQGTGDNRGIAITAVDFGNGTNAGIPGSDEIFSISNFRYVPGGVLDEEFDNIKSELKIYFELELTNAEYESNYKALQYVRTAGEGYVLGSFADQAAHDNIIKVPRSEAWIFSYNNLISDVHSPYSNQNLVRTKQVNYNLSGAGIYELLNVYGGDTFVSYQSILCSASVPTQLYRAIQADDAGVRNFIAWTVFSNNNWSFRHEVTESIFSRYYPKTNPESFALPEPEAAGGTFLWGPEEIALYNDIRYNDDYSRDNNLIALNIFDPQEEFATEFPNLIIRSVAQSPDTTAISWRTFLTNDRYTTDTSKGAISNLQGVANEHLLIHQIDSLFITRDRTTIKGDVTGASLGAGDIFDLTPKELVTSQDGHAGTQHRFSCKLTKAGYSFFDLKQGKWFLLQGLQDLQEISLRGFRNFFRDTVDKTISDNPFYTTGITVVYDEKYNRLLQSFINGEKSFTISYAPEIQGFASFHDYKANILFSTRSNRVFSVNNGFDSDLVSDNLYFGVYEHNTGTPGIFYNIREPEPVPFPMILDLVFNQDNYQRKVIQTIEWTSEVYDDELNEFYRDETFDYITVRTATKATVRTELERLVNLTRMHNSNTRRNESVWSFNAIRDVARNIQPVDQGFFSNYSLNPLIQPDLISWYNRGRFLDQYCVYRLEYSNLNGRRILLMDHSVNARISFR